MVGNEAVMIADPEVMAGGALPPDCGQHSSGSTHLGCRGPPESPASPHQPQGPHSWAYWQLVKLCWGGLQALADIPYALWAQGRWCRWLACGLRYGHASPSPISSSPAVDQGASWRAHLIMLPSGFKSCHTFSVPGFPGPSKVLNFPTGLHQL